MKRIALIAALLCPAPAALAAVGDDIDPLGLEGRTIQGALIRGTTEPGTRITIGKHKVRVWKDGHFVFGLGRKAPKIARLIAVLPSGRKIVRKLVIEQREYRIQRIDGLPKKKVTPPQDQIARIRAEARLIRKARRQRTDATWYRESFIWPARGVITGVYGSQRILNGKPRRPHYGTDIAAPEGEPLYAAASGIVSLAENDLFFTGKTVMIDHGHGVNTIYAHLSKLMVKKGDRVERGEPIGLIGSTGRVTGPHVHWGLNLFNSNLDPALMVESEPQKRREKVTPKLPAP